MWLRSSAHRRPGGHAHPLNDSPLVRKRPDAHFSSVPAELSRIAAPWTAIALTAVLPAERPAGGTEPPPPRPPNWSDAQSAAANVAGSARLHRREFPSAVRAVPAKA